MASSSSSGVSSSSATTRGGESGLSSWSPLSTLAKQYEPPLGQRLIIGIQANAACCLEGGVEAILKTLKQQGQSGDTLLSSESAPAVIPPTGFENDDADSRRNRTKSEDEFDAFSFLNEEDNAGTKNANGQPSGSSGGNKGFGGFLKKVGAASSKMAKNSAASLERQMQGLAVRMDGGKNPDLIRVAMYDSMSGELLGATEMIELPSSSSSSGTDPGPKQDIRFKIPLIVPGNRRQQQISLKLWIQSGAALLQTTKAAKNYLLGTATIDCSTMKLGCISLASLSSNLIVGGQLQLCVVTDPKFSQILTRGWSLTDPDMSGYSNNLHYLPLDSTYVFQGKKPEHWLVGTERTTESTIVLPIATAVMDLAAKASLKSLHHAQSVAKELRANRHDFKDKTKSTCQLGIVAVASNKVPNANAATASISVTWRRPDSIFELELAANQAIPVTSEDATTGFPTANIKFYPKLCTENILPGVLHAIGGQMPNTGFLIGALYFCVTIQSSASDQQIDIWETVIGLESFINNTDRTFPVPLMKNGEKMGNLLVQIQVSMPESGVANSKHRIIPSNDGLVSFVGLGNLADGVKPVMDTDASAGPDPTQSLRHQQLSTMGYFFTTQYMEQHLTLRQSAVEAFQERSRSYKQALIQAAANEPYETKTPKAFRPSSSRMEVNLSGIPFNVHIASLNVSVVDTLRSASVNQEYPGVSFHNITHGAPSDHARGFGNVMGGISQTVNASGGLRRLEAKRLECAQTLQQAQSLLIAGVGNYLATARKTGQVNHIPSRHAEIQGLRWKVFEAVHNLHHITWMCSVRRANVFSQSLGLALSSYLASISDLGKCAAGWPEIWKRHGYLVCYEGLLSAAGKELGMIEDASVAIAMLKHVRVVLMPDTGIPSNAVYIPSSPYLKWVNMYASGDGVNRHYLVQIGVDPQYYQDRIPAPLRNNVAVQLYPLLYQVGVDIRQWGAHAGKNLMKNGSTSSSNSSKQQPAEVTGGLVEDEDDDVGIVDEDVLVALNYEALTKMNAYAHAITPQGITLDKVQEAMNRAYAPQYIVVNSSNNAQQPGEQQLLPVHPSLSLLQSHIVSSAGRMNHSILDEAATIAQQLGGGGLVFCKSGKDRTAMHVTYKQAQFAARYRDQHELNEILRDATLLRVHGTRLPICEKNVGQAKYAFNSLQVKFMPDALKPPMNTLAGFLKGGRLFSGEGAIES